MTPDPGIIDPHEQSVTGQAAAQGPGTKPRQHGGELSARRVSTSAGEPAIGLDTLRSSTRAGSARHDAEDAVCDVRTSITSESAHEDSTFFTALAKKDRFDSTDVGGGAVDGGASRVDSLVSAVNMMASPSISCVHLGDAVEPATDTAAAGASPEPPGSVESRNATAASDSGSKGMAEAGRDDDSDADAAFEASNSRAMAAADDAGDDGRNAETSAGASTLEADVENDTAAPKAMARRTEPAAQGSDIPSTTDSNSLHGTPPFEPPGAESSQAMLVSTAGAVEASASADAGAVDAAAADVDADEDVATMLTNSGSTLERLEVLMTERQALQQQLSQYVSDLKTRTGEDGDRLVELPRNYLVMVEQMFRDKRSEYTTLQGWGGPRKYEDLPIGQLPTTHDDPRVEAGLRRIRELDTTLREKTLEAVVLERELFPDKWAELDKQRLAQHAQHVEELLKKQRKKRLQAARVARALSLLGDGSDCSDQAAYGYARGGYRNFELRPEDEEVLAGVLGRADADDEGDNPFLVDEAALDDVSVTSLQELDARLEQLMSEHGWDAATPRPPSGHSNGDRHSAHSRASQPASSTTSGVPRGRPDYLTERRTANQLAQQLEAVDARLRALKLAEPVTTLSAEQLQYLLESCRFMAQQDSNSVMSD